MSATPLVLFGATRAGLGFFMEGCALHASHFGCAAGAVWRYQGWVGVFAEGCALHAFRNVP